MPSKNTGLIVCQLRPALIHTTRQHRRPTPIPPRAAIMRTTVWWYVYEKYAPIHTQQTRGIHPMLLQCWSTVFDAGPTLKQHRSGECIVRLGRVVLARCALPQVCAARRESANSHDSRPTQLQITPQVGL